jgi:hypothetical protein
MESRLVLEPWDVQEKTLTVAATLEAGRARHRLWWQVPASWQDALTPWADPFIVGFLFPVMQVGADVVIEGRASPTLLENVSTFMEIWRCWFPDRYRPVKLRAAEEVEPPTATGADESICAFSGGVDSCFTMYRHHNKRLGRRNRHIGAALVMNGFDVWLDQQHATAVYGGLLDGARAILDSIGVPCIAAATNFHELPTIWAHSFGTQLVCGLRLFARRFGSGVLPNNMPYSGPMTSWGSNPLSDVYLANSAFRLYDDGGEHSRFEKAQVIAQWPAAMANLRVCFGERAARTHANCCACEKCIRTILAFRIAGAPRPAAFPRDVTDRQIRGARFHRTVNVNLWDELIRGAAARGMSSTPWARAMRVAARRNARRRVLNHIKRPFLPLRNLIRRAIRGSSLSRRQLEESRSRSMQPLHSVPEPHVSPAPDQAGALEHLPRGPDDRTATVSGPSSRL